MTARTPGLERLWLKQRADAMVAYNQCRAGRFDPSHNGPTTGFPPEVLVRRSVSIADIAHRTSFFLGRHAMIEVHPAEVLVPVADPRSDLDRLVKPRASFSSPSKLGFIQRPFQIYPPLIIASRVGLLYVGIMDSTLILIALVWVVFAVLGAGSRR